MSNQHYCRKNETTIEILLDLSQAFDTIDLKILHRKLDHYRFRGVVLELKKKTLPEWWNTICLI